MNTPVVLITGSARRVGAVIAQTLHAQGLRVLLHCHRSRVEASALAASLNTQRPDSATVLYGDLLDPEIPARIIDAALKVWGRLDYLVNNASSFFPTPIGQIDAAAWHDLMGSNLRAPLLLAQAAAPALQAARGAIVNITDIHAERPLAGYPLYSAAKGGLLTLTRALAIELAPAVRVNAVAPGPILWPDDAQFPPATREHIIQHTLLKRAGSPEDIANATRFLLLEAPFITGQVLNVDGGRTAHL